MRYCEILIFMVKYVYPLNTKERRSATLSIHDEFELQDCPYCGGAGLLEEENGWCWYVMCTDCGAQTAAFEYKSPETSFDAAQKAVQLWNIGKVIRGDIGE